MPKRFRVGLFLLFTLNLVFFMTVGPLLAMPPEPLPLFSGLTQIVGGVQVEVQIDPPIAEPGQTIKATFKVTNQADAAAAPSIDILLPSGTRRRREVWDPKKLPWDTCNAAKYTWEQRECIGYWWTLLSVFDASAPPVFASAFIKTYEDHEEDPVRRCFFSVTRDEQNHEQMCGLRSPASSATPTR